MLNTSPRTTSGEAASAAAASAAALRDDGGDAEMDLSLTELGRGYEALDDV